MDFTGNKSRIIENPTEALSVAVEEGLAWRVWTFHLKPFLMFRFLVYKFSTFPFFLCRKKGAYVLVYIAAPALCKVSPPLQVCTTDRSCRMSCDVMNSFIVHMHTYISQNDAVKQVYLSFIVKEKVMEIALGPIKGQPNFEKFASFVYVPWCGTYRAVLLLPFWEKDSADTFVSGQAKKVLGVPQKQGNERMLYIFIKYIFRAWVSKLFSSLTLSWSFRLLIYTTTPKTSIIWK